MFTTLARSIRYIAIIIVTIIFAVGVYFLWQQFLKQPGISINLNRAAVIKEMRELQHLETASFTIEKIIDASVTEGNKIRDFLFGDKLLLIAHGEVVAGFDLSQMKDEDISVTGGKLVITLPKPQILFTRLDNSKTRVYDRTTGIFSKGEKDLEAEARQQAEKSITEAACQANILRQASDNARKQLSTLFSGLGFTEITVVVPEASCQ